MTISLGVVLKRTVGFDSTFRSVSIETSSKMYVDTSPCNASNRLFHILTSKTSDKKNSPSVSVLLRIEELNCLNLVYKNDTIPCGTQHTIIETSTVYGLLSS